ncbi:hypothetical protein TNCV_545671 [Trichonephila clavipes]|nr:hypothetical protein TNCV_545671 [Trichonephila clavipes]
MNKIRKIPVGLDCPIVLSEEFVAVDDDNVYSPNYGRVPVYVIDFSILRTLLTFSIKILTRQTTVKGNVSECCRLVAQLPQPTKMRVLIINRRAAVAQWLRYPTMAGMS